MNETINTSWHSYPKIWNLGHPSVDKLFEEPVLVEEKVDGSQFSFGVINGELRCRSKGQELNMADPEKLFTQAVITVRQIADKLTPGWTYRGEYLKFCKHNTLKYDRIPESHIAIFDINTGHERYLGYEEKAQESSRIGLEVVPVMFHGTIGSFSDLQELLNTESFLGGAKVEGVVCKNYSRFTPDGKAMMGKFVSEAFKEIHGKEWKKANPGHGDVIQQLIDRYRTEARWAKAVQRLKENGLYTGTPRDIGELMKALSQDSHEELAQEVQDFLMSWAWPQVNRGIGNGVAEWYKEELAKSQFGEQ